MTTAITPIPPLDWTSPTFKTDLEAMFSTRFPNLTIELTNFLAALTTLASGGAFDIPLKFSTTTTVGDPGSGFLRLNTASAATATIIDVDIIGADAKDYTTLLDTMNASSSLVLGQIKLVKLADPTKFMHFNLVQYTTASGYRQLSVVSTGYSDVMPFANNDMILLRFNRTGDRGSVGPAGTLVRRTVSVTANSAPAPDVSITDTYSDLGLTAAVVVGAPTASGTAASDGQSLVFRFRDNGTARAISWNAIYRAGSDVILPTTTVAGKLLYVGFMYNAVDGKWDLVSTLGNI